MLSELTREDQKRRAEECLDASLLEGLDSGKPIRANAEFWSGLRGEGRTKLKALALRKKGK